MNSSYKVLFDNHGGLHVRVQEPGDKVKEFIERVIWNSNNGINYYHEGKDEVLKSIWVEFVLPVNWMSIARSLPERFEIKSDSSGFVMDQRTNTFSVWKWLLNTTCMIPEGPSFVVGATAMVVDRIRSKVLLVSPLNRNYLCFPGGNYDVKDLGFPILTAIRELKEETGIVVSDEKGYMMGMMEFPDNQHGPALNITYLFDVADISAQALEIDDQEISTCGWYDLQEIVECKGTLEIQGHEFKTIGDEIIQCIRGYLKDIYLTRADRSNPKFRKIINYYASPQ